MTMMSVERWMNMSRKSLATSRRGCFAVRVMIFLCPIPAIGLWVTGILSIRRVNITGVLLILVCFLITTVNYLKVLRIIRQHQRQVRWNHSSTQTFGQPAINLAKVKKSFTSILFILALFSVCFLPLACSLMWRLIAGDDFEKAIVTEAFFVLVFLAPYLNPGLYVWRIREIRVAVRALFCFFKLTINHAGKSKRHVSIEVTRMDCLEKEKETNS